MVSIEDLLKRVQQAGTEAERQWILLELQMSQMSEALVAMLWASSIPHFFDANVLAALRPELADEAEGLFAELQTLTFVEDFPGQGYNVHELTRGVLLSRLWEHDREEFLMLSKRAADYFFEIGTSPEEDVEFCYHEILKEGNAQTGRLLDRATGWWNYYQDDRIQSALQSFSEHEKAGRISAFGRGFSLHLDGLTKDRSVNYGEAESFFNRAQAVYESIKLKDPRYMATLLRDLSTSKKEQGNIGEAIPLCEQSLEICEKQLGTTHPDTANSLNNLASLYQSLGRYGEAEPLCLRALKINEEQLGATHPDTANSLNNLAGLYQRLGRYEEAEPLHLRALKIREEQLGATHPDTANSLNNLAALYQSLERYGEAEPLYLRALKIREQQLGATHPDTAISLNNLAALYREQKRYLETIPLLEKWQSIKRERRETQNRLFAERICTLGKLYEECQRFPEAVAAYEEALSLLERLLGAKNRRVDVLRGELARLNKRIKKESKKCK